MSNQQIDVYIAGLNYDPRVLLSVVPDGTTSSLPIKARQAVNNGVVICTKIQHSLKKNLDEVAILSPTTGVIFPGALVLADQNMVDGHPTPIPLPRRPATLSLDLPGLADPSETLVPNYSEIQKFLNGKLEVWNNVPASQQGYSNAARSILQITKAFSSQQLALDLGFNAKWASGSASAQLGVSSTTEKSVMLAYYKQVFYTVTMNTPQPASSVFSDDVTLAQAQQAFNHAGPPAYVRSVDYGRILMVKMESSEVDTSVNLKAAFEQATAGGVTAGGDLAAKYANIIRNSSFTVLAIGGGAESPVQMFDGTSNANLTGLREYIAKDAKYRRDNPGMPIAYTLAFLKDNQFARMGFTTDYTEDECVRYNNGFVRLVQDGAYVAKFEVTWQEPDSGGHTINKQWDSGEKTAGYSYQLDLPGDAQGVRIKAWAATGLVWDPWGEIMNVSLNGPDNKTYRARGTTLNRSWDNG
jgi:thiol-activated cytolysin